MEIQGKWFSTVSTRLLLLSLLLALLPTMASAQTNLGIKQRPKISESSQDIIQFAVPTNDGLVAYYPFNGNANDESGNGNNGTVIGHVELASDRFGNPNSAYRFFGEPLNYISVPDAESLHCNTFTLSAWVYTDAEDYGNGYLINKGRDISNGSYRLSVRGVGASTEYGGVNDAYIEEHPVTKVWHMVTGTVEGDVAKFYLDGVLMDEKTLSHPFVYSNSDPLTLGMHYYTGVPSFWAYPLLGVLDDVRIYSRALSPGEVKALYIKEMGGDYLVAYYPFNGNANDESGNGNNGTVIGHVELAPDRFGNPNSAYRFFGEPLNYISVPDTESLHCNTFTLSAWVYTDAEDYGNGYLINKGRDISNGSYRLSVRGVGASTEYGGVNDAYIEEYPVTKVWHMATGTVEGDVAKFYLDGVLMDEKTLSHPFVYSNSDPLTLGMHYYTGVPSFWAYPLLGVLDDVRIYNRVLSTAEVNTLYTMEKGGGLVKGDVNGDGVVDVADISSIISVMSKGDNNLTADVNGDGVVDVADISTVITIMAGKNYDAVLQIWLSDGQVTVVNLSEEPRTTYSDGNLTITTTKTTITYPLERVRRYTYANVNNGYNSRQGTFVTNDGEALILTGMEANAAITLYNSAGQLLHTDSTNSQGAAIVSVSHFPQGKYTIKSNGVTYKITKQ